MAKKKNLLNGRKPAEAQAVASRVNTYHPAHHALWKGTMDYESERMRR
jgi:hypothetical protein